MTQRPQFELFDHTADIGVRVRAPTLAGLLAPATEGLYAVIGRIATKGDAQPRTMSYGAPGADSDPGQADSDRALLLRDYLADVLHEFDAGRRIVVDVRPRAFTRTRLDVDAVVQPLDSQASEFEREVKAVTYHELAIRRLENDGWEAVYIVDI